MQWLLNYDNVTMESLVKPFQKHNITGIGLIKLTDEILKTEIGIIAYGTRVTFLDAKDELIKRKNIDAANKMNDMKKQTVKTNARNMHMYANVNHQQDKKISNFNYNPNYDFNYNYNSKFSKKGIKFYCKSRNVSGSMNYTKQTTERVCFGLTRIMIDKIYPNFKYDYQIIAQLIFNFTCQDNSFFLFYFNQDSIGHNLVLVDSYFANVNKKKDILTYAITLRSNQCHHNCKHGCNADIYDAQIYMIGIEKKYFLGGAVNDLIQMINSTTHRNSLNFTRLDDAKTRIMPNLLKEKLLQSV